MCYNECWQASLPFMCLDHIIGHETCYFFFALPLKRAPTCFTKQHGTSRTQGFEYTWWSGLQIMFNAQHKVHVTCELHWWCTNWIARFFVNIVVRRFARHIFDTFNKKWRQVKPKKRLFYFIFKIALFGHMLKKISTFTFWCMVMLLGSHSVYT